MEALNEDDKHRIRNAFRAEYTASDIPIPYPNSPSYGLFLAKEKAYRSKLLINISKSIFATQPAHLLDRWQEFICAELEINGYHHLEAEIKNLNQLAKSNQPLISRLETQPVTQPQLNPNIKAKISSAVTYVWSVVKSRGAIENWAGNILMAITVSIFSGLFALFMYVANKEFALKTLKTISSIIDDILY